MVLRLPQLPHTPLLLEADPSVSADADRPANSSLHVVDLRTRVSSWLYEEATNQAVLRRLARPQGVPAPDASILLQMAATQQQTASGGAGAGGVRRSHSHCSLLTAHCSLLAPCFLLLATYYLLLATHCLLFAPCYLLLTTGSLLPTTCYLLPAARYLQPVTYYSPLTMGTRAGCTLAYYILLTTRYLLFAARLLLLTTYYLLLTTCYYPLAADRTLAPSWRLSTAQTSSTASPASTQRSSSRPCTLRRPLRWRTKPSACSTPLRLHPSPTRSKTLRSRLPSRRVTLYVRASGSNLHSALTLLQLHRRVREQCCTQLARCDSGV